MGRGRTWLLARPALAAWIFPADDDSPEARFREFNGWYFANFHEQEKMLADRPRMNFYHAAIARHIQPGDRVIDLGTGTGILAAFAARRGAAQVYAVDHSEIVRHAKTLAVENGIQNVEFIALHSSKLETTEKVDVILSTESTTRRGVGNGLKSRVIITCGAATRTTWSTFSASPSRCSQWICTRFRSRRCRWS